MSLPALWAELAPVGRQARTGGYRRFAWTRTDAELRAWFSAAATERGLSMTADRAGNLWAWWGDPDSGDGQPGLVLGSHLDSVPDGGAFDGPLGVVSAFAAVDALRAKGVWPSRPLGVACFADEEGARFGIACAGSRLLTGALDPEVALARRDDDATTMAEAMRAAGHDPGRVGPDPQTLRRVGTFIELHIEQGRHLVDAADGAAVGVASSIWPHGRWRLDLPGRADHAGTTRLADRADPMLALATGISTARRAAQDRSAVATVAKVHVEPNAVNAIPSAVTAWLDARGPDPHAVRDVVADVGTATDTEPVEESWTPPTTFDPALRDRLAGLLAGPDGRAAPVLATGAGHDAGILARAGVPTAMLFVRNPTGISHSPAERAETADCLAGVEALVRAVELLG